MVTLSPRIILSRASAARRPSSMTGMSMVVSGGEAVFALSVLLQPTTAICSGTGTFLFFSSASRAQARSSEAQIKTGKIDGKTVFPAQFQTVFQRTGTDAFAEIIRNRNLFFWTEQRKIATLRFRQMRDSQKTGFLKVNPRGGHLAVRRIVFDKEVWAADLRQFGKRQSIQLVRADQETFGKIFQTFILKTPGAGKHVKEKPVSPECFVDSADQSAGDRMRHICRIIDQKRNFSQLLRCGIPEKRAFPVHAVDIPLRFELPQCLTDRVARQMQTFSQFRFGFQPSAVRQRA